MQTVEELIRTGMLSKLYAEQKPDAMALADDRETRSFRQLHENANRLARLFASAGLGQGDGVAMLCGNSVRFVEIQAAASRSGVRLTPINWHLSPAEVEYIVRDCQAKALIADADFADAALASVNDGPRIKLAVGGEIDGFDAYDAALDSQSPDDPENPVHGSGMLYTSGTTGKPKGVLRKGIHLLPPQHAGTAYNYDPAIDRNLCCGPAYHGGPLHFDIRMPLISGVPIVLMRKFDAENWLAQVERHRITHSHLVATMFQRLLRLPEDVRRRYDTSSLKTVFHGAAPTPPEIKRAMIAWLGPVLVEYYAATEGAGGFLVGSEEWLSKPGTVGRLNPELGARILDEAGRDVGPGVIGQLYFRNDQVAPFEYFNDPDKTSGVSRGEHFTVGDAGYVDEDGYLFLTGRTAECIISGGVNIYPQEIDDQLVQHPAVLDVCTLGAPSEDWGEEVKSVVALAPGYEPSEALALELIAFARARLAHFKAPRSIDFAPDLPRSEAGKIQRRLIRAPYWAGRDRQM